jgi:hypothetical protein
MRDTLLAAFEDQKNVRSRLESIVGVSTAGGGVRACQCACQHVAQQPTVQQRRAGVANAQQRQAGDQFLSLPDYADSGTGTVNSLSSSSGSQDLHDWLKGLGVDDVSIQKFILEAFLLSDVLELMEREDLRKLELRGGMELRVWRAILEYRGQRTPSRQRQPSSNGDARLSAGGGGGPMNPPRCIVRGVSVVDSTASGMSIGDEELAEDEEEDTSNAASASSPPSTPTPINDEPVSSSQ